MVEGVLGHFPIGANVTNSNTDPNCSPAAPGIPPLVLAPKDRRHCGHHAVNVKIGAAGAINAAAGRPRTRSGRECGGCSLRSVAAGDPMKLTRQGFFATLGAVAAGVTLDALDQRSGPQTAGHRAGRPPADAEGMLSFAQSGEDLIANFIFYYLRIPKITYLDVGAHDPVAFNNTYFFYRRGFRGVMVEPNVEMCKKLRAVRPQDTTLEAGIGVTAAREADYYLMTESSWNTFSKEEADHMTRATRGGIKIE